MGRLIKKEGLINKRCKYDKSEVRIINPKGLMGKIYECKKKRHHIGEEDLIEV